MDHAPIRPLPEEHSADNETRTFAVDNEQASVRLDRFLAEKLHDAGLSREKLKSLIRAGAVCVDALPARSPNLRLTPGCRVSIVLPEQSSGLTPEEGELSVVYHDEVLALINKAAGIVVHPAPGLPTGTLVHRLLARFPSLASQEGFRPGIVHRLDKDTSGLMLAALTEPCRLALSAMFARHEIRKEYLALTHGVPEKSEGLIDAPIGRHPTHKTKMAVTAGGRPAQSAWRVLYADPAGRFALVAVRIFSGRTHQVRVHMQHIGHPLWGDTLYGGKAVSLAASDPPRPARCSLHAPTAAHNAAPPSRQMLHAWKLGFLHPMPEKLAQEHLHQDSTCTLALHGTARLFALCPPPQDFREAARFLSRQFLKVVVTGSPGCGKSSLLALWRQAGIPVLSADEEVRRLYEAGGDGQRLLRARFGNRFVPHENAPVDKLALGEAMREDQALRREVEALVHPLVRHAVFDFWKKEEALGADLAVAEIPLYLEAGFAQADKKAAASAKQEEAPVLVGVYCPFALRRERLSLHRGWPENIIEYMESWQWPEKKKMAACHLVIENLGTEKDLAEQAESLSLRLRELRQGREEAIMARLEALWSSAGEENEDHEAKTWQRN